MENILKYFTKQRLLVAIHQRHLKIIKVTMKDKRYFLSTAGND